MDERQIIEQEIRDLKAKLSDSNSEIGDWKVSKCIEYEKTGLPPPYDFEELAADRQEVRNRINELEKQLKGL